LAVREKRVPALADGVGRRGAVQTDLGTVDEQGTLGDLAVKEDGV
jgi:hypothetical protein